MKRKLYVSQLDDPQLQSNFYVIGDEFNNNPFLKGSWKFIEFEVTASGSGQKIPHRLNYTPLDFIVLSTRQGTITLRYDLFDETYFGFDATVTTSPLKVRGFIGRYTEDTIGV